MANTYVSKMIHIAIIRGSPVKTTRHHFPLVRIAVTKRQTCWQGNKEKNWASYTLLMEMYTTAMKNNVEVFFKKKKTN